MNNVWIVWRYNYVTKTSNFVHQLCIKNSYASKARCAISIGHKASLSKTFTQEEVETFARISGDNNPIHIDEEFAKNTRYQQRIVHGILTVGLLSGILGTKLPGHGSVLISYEVRHLAPLFIGEKVEAEASVKNIKGRKVTMEMMCSVPESNKIILKGTSELLVPRDILP